jgi:small subunit ribosomal protein S1
MLTHDQKNEQDEVKSEMMEETASVNEEQQSTQSTEDVETQEQEEPTADVAPVPEETIAEPIVEEAPVVEEITPEPAPEPVVEEAPVAKKTRTVKPKAEQADTQQNAEQSEMMQLLVESESNLKKGQIVEGTVVNITDKEVMVDIGYKSEGVISIAEFAYSGIPVKNEKINVYISEMEDGEGKLHLSKKRADFILNIKLLKETFQKEGTVQGFIRRRVKGGMIVDVLGIEAFLPGSQMSLKPIPNLDQFIGKEQTFKIVSLDEEKRNIIISRKKVLEEEISVKRNELLSHIEIGAELEGEVKNITQYGAFIDLGGIDGLLHMTDMSWGKVNHPAEMLNIGDKLKVKVIQYDAESGKISLGLKQLVPHPWEHIEIKYPEGTRVAGKVVSVKSYGAFVEIEPGVEGLVHISEMSWTKKIADARRVLKVNDTVNAIVLELDKENKRISLGMKQMEANPWLTIEDRYPVGTVVKRKIKSMTTFGAFVEIEEGIDGLIHISDISWTKRIYHPKEVYKKFQEVEAIVLSIDRALHRVALGVKQLRSDPWETLPIKLPVNTEIKGKISKLIPKGVLIDVMVEDYVVEGFVPISHLGIPKLEHSEDAFYIGEELPLKVIELDTENRRLIMSVKAFFFSRDAKLQEEYIALHEQYIRERVSRLQKKKADKDAKQRDKDQNDQVMDGTDEEAMDNDVIAETAVETVPEMETQVEPSETMPSEIAEAVIEETPAPEVEIEDSPVMAEPVAVEAEITEEEEPVAEVLTIAEEPAVEAETPAEEKPAKAKKEPKEKAPAKPKKAATDKKPLKEKAADGEAKPVKVKAPAKAKKEDTE